MSVATPSLRRPEHGRTPQWVLPRASADVYRRVLAIRSTQASFVRVWRGFLAGRFALGAALLFSHLAYWWAGKEGSAGLAAVAGVYWATTGLTWALVAAALDKPRSTWEFLGLWSATVGVDLVLFGAFYLQTEGSVNYLPLFVLPTLMASVLGTRLFALFVAAAMTCLLLTDASLALLREGSLSPGLAQAGVLASALFIVALLANQLAVRLERQEAVARESQLIARRQVEVSRLVIEQMFNGVLVVDDQGVVQSVNPAARRLLGDDSLRPPFLLAARPRTATLAAFLGEQVSDGSSATDLASAKLGSEGTVIPAGAGGRPLLVRCQLVGHGEAEEASPFPWEASGFRVLFLEDAQASQARLQQEKMAAMGRLTAGVAHEIRNPLAAIAHASALLAEEAIAPAQQRLLGMVRQNTDRLDRLVDDILEVARTQAHSSMVDATTMVAETVQEWQMANPAEGHGLELQGLDPNTPVMVWFDPDHLRRVVVNLLDNAVLHGQSGVVGCQLMVTADTAELCVANPGPVLAPDVQARLFEPFFSTRSRGSGLGLHLCAELCTRHGASLLYERRAETNAFVLRMRLASTGAAA